MIPVKLHLSGFLSYLDPVDVDFTSFELACISGNNGAGKSSLLDAMTWALFGQARRKDDSLINSHAQAAEVTFEFRYENNLYRVQRAKPREKTTVLEFSICTEDGIWKPLTEKSVRETDARIQSTLRMDYETFTNASFLLQGRADQFATQRPGDRKKVLSAILGLEVWEKYRTNTADRRKQVEGDLKGIDAQITDIDGELALEDERKRKLADSEARLEQASQLRRAKDAQLESLRRQAASLEEQRRMVEMLAQTAGEARQRVDRTQADMERLNLERGEYQAVIAGEAATRAAFQRLQELRADLARWDGVAANFREIEARRAGPLATINAEAGQLDQRRQKLLEQQQAIRQQESRLPEMESRRAALGDLVAKLEEQVAQRPALEKGLAEVQAGAAEAQVENRALKAEMLALKERIDRLQEVEGAVCPLCGQPLEAADRARLMADLQAQGKDKGDHYRANLELQNQVEARVREVQQQMAALVSVERDLRSQAREYDRLDAECKRIHEGLEAWKTGEALELAEVTRKINEADFAHPAREELAKIDEQSRALGYDSAAHQAARDEELAAREAEQAIHALDAAKAALGPVERQIAGLEKQLVDDSARLAEASQRHEEARARYEREAAALPDINQAERELFDVQSDENRLRGEVGMYKQAVAVLKQQRTKRARLSAERETLTVQIARLKTLERAFSKDGVPALLIEQALPEIETQANELLDRLSNGNMSVRFETQRLYKDKSRDDKRETLDIIISDPAGPREYELFSGGEAFRVNFAIRLALSRVLAQRAGARLQSLVIDEGFGSQDADGRQRLIEAINMVRPEFAKILVITHMEELKEAFPSRIEVEKTLRGSRVNVIS